MPDVKKSAIIIKYGILLLFLISVVLHVLIVMQYTRPGLPLVLILTAGMILAWLYASRMIRLLGESYPERNPWQVAVKMCPPWLKYLTGFLFLYALSNFVIMVDPEPADGYFSTSLPYGKLRGLSGFWIAFYGLSYAVLRVSSGTWGEAAGQGSQSS